MKDKWIGGSTGTNGKSQVIFHDNEDIELECGCTLHEFGFGIVAEKVLIKKCSGDNEDSCEYIRLKKQNS